MSETAAVGVEHLSTTLEAEALLRQLGAEALVAEPGYVEIAASATGAEAGASFSAGAVAMLAEAAARLAAGGETAELSLHVHDLSRGDDAARLLARGELVREPRADRPLATAQADVFKVSENGAEALLATALVSLLARP